MTLTEKIYLRLPYQGQVVPRVANPVSELKLLGVPHKVLEAHVQNKFACLRLSELEFRTSNKPEQLGLDVCLALANALCDELEIETDEYVAHEEVDMLRYYVMPKWYWTLTLWLIDYLVNSDLYWGWLADCIHCDLKSHKSIYRRTEYHHFYGGFPLAQKEGIRERNNRRHF